MPWVNHLVKSEPVLLFHQGRFLPTAMRRARVAEDEVLAVLREQGRARLDGIEAIVLETDGSLSVIGRADASPETLSTVRVPGPEELPLH